MSVELKANKIPLLNYKKLNAQPSKKNNTHYLIHKIENLASSPDSSGRDHNDQHYGEAGCPNPTNNYIEHIKPYTFTIPLQFKFVNDEF